MTTSATHNMSAVRLRTDSRALDLESVPIPSPGRGEVLLKVAYAGLCHTDLHFIDGELADRMPDQITLGHEVSAVVAALGAEVTNWSIGDNVILNPVRVRDGETFVLGVHWNGGFADYLVAPIETLVRVPASVPLDQATVIADAVSTSWAAITDAAQVRPTESVAVWGLGGLGYHAVKLLRLVGAAPIIAIDPNPAARERALRVGADHALDPGSEGFVGTLAELVGPGGLDAAFDFVGHPAVQQQAFDAVRRGGRVVFVGIPTKPLVIDSSPKLIRLSKRIIGHYGMEKHHLEELVRLVEHGRLDLQESVSEVLPLSDYATAIDHLRHQVGAPIRILLQP